MNRSGGYMASFLKEVPLSIEKLANMYGLYDAHVRLEGERLILVGKSKWLEK